MSIRGAKAACWTSVITGGGTGHQRNSRGRLGRKGEEHRPYATIPCRQDSVHGPRAVTFAQPQAAGHCPSHGEAAYTLLCDRQPGAVRRAWGRQQHGETCVGRRCAQGVGQRRSRDSLSLAVNSRVANETMFARGWRGRTC